MASQTPSQVIGVCVHCGQDLYAGQPVAHGIDNAQLAPLAHVGCAVDALRER